MTFDRRKFLRTTGLFASGIALGASACNSEAKKENADSSATAPADTASTAAAAPQGTALPLFGIQLYTLRDDLPKDPKGILKQLAGFGYKQAEGFEGNKGLFWGMSNTEFKKYMDEIGMDFVSSHCDINKNFEKKAAEAGAIGMKYLISPYIGPQKTLDDYKKFADTFNKLGEVCKKNGLKFAYHNHGYTFEQIDGQYPQDVLMQNTDPALVDFEMDIYWVVYPGQDPLTWLKKYPNRWRLCHVKDRMKNAGPKEDNASTDLGTGSIDFATILKEAKAQGMEYYIVEQERYDNSTPLKSAEVDAQYLKNLKI
ncbi:sugar phosphate isomerase/epimerase [Pollutibacter soli]|uniref:sugar phosphate isomerase/epimerase family protein n=1 Tax=Pollutibacter soli TaxID=3034157 RepID=UPI003013AF26